MLNQTCPRDAIRNATERHNAFFKKLGLPQLS